MQAVQWMGKHHVAVSNAPDPEIVNPHDARVSLTAICGSDLHIYDGFISTMKKGDVWDMNSWEKSWRPEPQLTRRMQKRATRYAHSGWESQSRWSPSPLTRLSDRVIDRNNERIPAGELQ